MKDPKGHAGVPLLPLPLKICAACWLFSPSSMITDIATTSWPMESASEMACRVRRETPVTGTMTRVSLAYGLLRQDTYAQFPRCALVVGVYAPEEEHEGRNGQYNHPRSLGELRDEEDRGGQRGDDGTESVDRYTTLPVGRPVLPPVHDQPGLGEGEAGEHADGEQRDHLIGVAADGDQQGGGQAGKYPDAVAEDLSIVPHGEEMGQVVVPRQQLARIGSPPNEVLAARARTTVMVRDTK